METRKPDYKNWMPKGMVIGFGVAAAVFLAVGVIAHSLMDENGLKTAVVIIAYAAAVILAAVTIWCAVLYRAFDYNGTRKMSKQIIDGLSDYVVLPEGGVGLDVGCGSGALTIACAKKNPRARMVGIDRWGIEYSDYSKLLCAQNAEAEGVSNVEFGKGDANKLDFADGSFDAVTSNYVYHNIPVRDRQVLLRETLRCLKKGGTFAIHDIFSKAKYGDMEKFVRELKDSGYESVELIDTTNGMFMSHKEAFWMELAGSAILYGKK